MKNQGIAHYILAAFVAALSLASCQKTFDNGSGAGREVRFRIVSNAVSNYTKAAYSGITDNNRERIDWETDDQIRIYCAQAVKPAGKYADYMVTSVETPSSEHPEVSAAHIKAIDGNGFVWGDGIHTFYAVYPKPQGDCIAQSISGKDVSASLAKTQGSSEETVSGHNTTFVPDLKKNMLMTAKAVFNPQTDSEGSVSLNFIPLVTAVRFTIINRTGKDLSVETVSLLSESSPLNGPFAADLDNTSTPEAIDLGNETITYTRSYPECTVTEEVTDARKSVDIHTGKTLSFDEDVAGCGSLTFTFLLLPAQNLDDLTFKLTKDNGDWMSSRLSYTDGSGIIFPRFMKTEVEGVFIPGEKVQWTIKYGPEVASWNTGVDQTLQLEEEDE